MDPVSGLIWFGCVVEGRKSIIHKNELYVECRWWLVLTEGY